MTAFRVLTRYFKNQKFTDFSCQTNLDINLHTDYENLRKTAKIDRIDIITKDKKIVEIES